MGKCGAGERYKRVAKEGRKRGFLAQQHSNTQLAPEIVKMSSARSKKTVPPSPQTPTRRSTRTVDSALPTPKKWVPKPASVPSVEKAMRKVSVQVDEPEEEEDDVMVLVRDDAEDDEAEKPGFVMPKVPSGVFAAARLLLDSTVDSVSSREDRCGKERY